MEEVGSTDANQGKVSLKRFDLALHKFTDVAIPMHLELLHKHRDNIKKFTRLDEWDRVHREQVNASRTVQQLKADIWEVEKVRHQLRDEDIPAFDKRVNPVKAQALDAVHAFIEEHREVADPTRLLFPPKRKSDVVEGDDEMARADSDIIEGDTGIQDQAQEVVQVQQTSASASSWRNLYHELLGLNNMIHMFHKEVNHQQAAVDSIQENLETTEINVHEGAKQLGMATKLKAAMLPLTGAIIGCVAAGPVGLLAGFKLGGVAAAVGGGVIGYQSGRYLKRRRETIADVELKELSKPNPKGSLSLPDINNAVDSDDRTLTPRELKEL